MTRVRQFVVATGTVVIVFALGWYHAHYRAPTYQFGKENPFWAFALLAGFYLVAGAILGVPEEPRNWQPAIFTSVVAAALGTGAFALVLLFAPHLLPRFVLTASPIAVGAWDVGCCIWAHRQRTAATTGDRVLAVLGPQESAFLRTEAGAGFPHHEVAFALIDAVPLSGPTTADRPSADRLRELATRERATVLVLSDEAQQHEAIVDAAAALHADGVRIRSLEGFCDEWLGKLPLSSLNRMALMTDIGEVHGGPYVHLKRGADILAGVVGAVLCIVAVPLVWIANRIANRGRLVFRQPRVGRGGRTFTMYKFRTMHPDAEEGDHDLRSPWTELDDPRVTPFGRILRRTHLDELPQFVNILRGELSLVGPRPEQPHYVEELIRKLPFYGLRHVAQPGLTGWAQVKYRYGSSAEDAFEKLQYDLYYLRHQSVSLDLRILSRTLRSVLFGRGR